MVQVFVGVSLPHLLFIPVVVGYNNKNWKKIFSPQAPCK
jgi:hypothetical protein